MKSKLVKLSMMMCFVQGGASSAAGPGIVVDKSAGKRSFMQRSSKQKKKIRYSLCSVLFHFARHFLSWMDVRIIIIGCGWFSMEGEWGEVDSGGERDWQELNGREETHFIWAADFFSMVGLQITCSLSAFLPLYSWILRYLQQFNYLSWCQLQLKMWFK